MQASIDFDGTLIGSIAGGGGGGSDVSITPTYNQGVKIADYSIDGNEGAIYTPEIEISKNVLSGVKICEIEGVEIFAPSYGYIDTLGDSNVEQIGGFSEGLNVTPVKVKRVSYTNDVSNGEKIGSLTVGDTSYNVYQKPNSNINYSTTEQDTGIKWVDGKSIYRKTYININLSNSQDIVLDSNVSTMQLLSYDIDFCGIPNTLTNHIENTSDTLYIDNRGLVYYINRTTSWWNELNKANITVYYTRSGN